jgi:hypothetical protein
MPADNFDAADPLPGAVRPRFDSLRGAVRPRVDSLPGAVRPQALVLEAAPPRRGG